MVITSIWGGILIIFVFGFKWNYDDTNCIVILFLWLLYLGTALSKEVQILATSWIFLCNHESLVTQLFQKKEIKLCHWTTFDCSTHHTWFLVEIQHPKIALIMFLDWDKKIDSLHFQLQGMTWQDEQENKFILLVAFINILECLISIYWTSVKGHIFLKWIFYKMLLVCS